MQKVVGIAIVGDGKFGFKFFGETFDTADNSQYWENRGYLTVPVYADVDAEMEEFYFY